MGSSLIFTVLSNFVFLRYWEDVEVCLTGAAACFAVVFGGDLLLVCFLCLDSSLGAVSVTFFLEAAAVLGGDTDLVGFAVGLGDFLAVAVGAFLWLLAALGGSLPC